MTLDEIEIEAARTVRNWDGMPSHATAVSLARALLAVLPVVRAAEKYADRIKHHPGNKAGLVLDEATLIVRVKAMRTRLTPADETHKEGR
jgi:hypothetical protein